MDTPSILSRDLPIAQGLARAEVDPERVRDDNGLT